MKIQCRCGSMIVDQTDDQPRKAHLIPDQDWFRVLEAIDRAIEESSSNENRREAACMEIRSLLSRVTRPAWQCRECGRLHLDDPCGRLLEFVPADAEAPRDLFRGRTSKPTDA